MRSSSCLARLPQGQQSLGEVDDLVHPTLVEVADERAREAVSGGQDGTADCAVGVGVTTGSDDVLDACGEGVRQR